MRRILLTSLALAVAATPAVADRGADAPDRGPKPPKHERPERVTAPDRGPKPPKHERPVWAKGPKGAHHLVHACVVADATETGVDLSVLGGNRHMRRALDGKLKGTTFTANLDTETTETKWTTHIRLVGKARHQLPEGSTEKRLPRIGTWDDLDEGDRVIVRFRAERGTPSADLVAFKVIDRGPSKRCAPSPPPVEDPVGETPDDGSNDSPAL